MKTELLFFYYINAILTFSAYHDIIQPSAGMVKLADTPDLGSGGAILAGSSPVTRTIETRLTGRSVLFQCIWYEPARY